MYVAGTIKIDCIRTVKSVILTEGNAMLGCFNILKKKKKDPKALAASLIARSHFAPFVCVIMNQMNVCFLKCAESQK